MNKRKQKKFGFRLGELKKLFEENDGLFSLILIAIMQTIVLDFSRSQTIRVFRKFQISLQHSISNRMVDDDDDDVR